MEEPKVQRKTPTFLGGGGQELFAKNYLAASSSVS